jgi:hypothetical protein
MQEYPLAFTQDIWLTEIDRANAVTGDHQAKKGDRFRILKQSEEHASSPGIKFSTIAMPGTGSLATESVFIVPKDALTKSSSKS